MGLGDQLMATGMARGAAAKGKRIAFGDGRRILWDGNSPTIFQGNPNIAPPGSERAGDIEWIEFYKGNRVYNRLGSGRWIWNYDFRAIPGEIYFTAEERQCAGYGGPDFIVIEPNVPAQKTVARNKQWPVDRYYEVALRLIRQGYDVRQFYYGSGHRIPGAKAIHTPTFRHALAVLERASLYIGPEGGLHHGSAAVDVPAVVLFGGFIPPQVTGYDTHTNLTGGAEACGSLNDCEHCKAAMDTISVDEVFEAARRHLAHEIRNGDLAEHGGDRPLRRTSQARECRVVS